MVAFERVLYGLSVSSPVFSVSYFFLLTIEFIHPLGNFAPCVRAPGTRSVASDLGSVMLPLMRDVGYPLVDSR